MVEKERNVRRQEFLIRYDCPDRWYPHQETTLHKGNVADNSKYPLCFVMESCCQLHLFWVCVCALCICLMPYSFVMALPLWNWQGLSIKWKRQRQRSKEVRSQQSIIGATQINLQTLSFPFL